MSCGTSSRTRLRGTFAPGLTKLQCFACRARLNRGIAIGVHFLAKTMGEGHGNGAQNGKKKAIAEIKMTAKKQPATEAGGSEAPHHSTDRECHGGGGAVRGLSSKAILPRRRWTTS
jgi:hypothetical protein